MAFLKEAEMDHGWIMDGSSWMEHHEGVARADLLSMNYVHEFCL